MPGHPGSLGTVHDFRFLFLTANTFGKGERFGAVADRQKYATRRRRPVRWQGVPYVNKRNQAIKRAEQVWGGNGKRKYWLFDTFEGLPPPSEKDDYIEPIYESNDKHAGRVAEGYCLGTIDEVENLLFET